MAIVDMIDMRMPFACGHSRAVAALGEGWGAAAHLSELGCAEQEIMAITGHRTSKEVTRYTRAVRQKTRAESALRRIRGTNVKQKCPSFLADGKRWGNFAT